jgi:hypothetical protein
MTTTEFSPGLVLGGGDRFAAALRGYQVPGSELRGFVYDASSSAPNSWPELEAELDDVFALTKAAVLEGAPILYIVREAAIWGHAAPLPSALATALLGGMRSAAVELARAGIAANALAVGDHDDPERVVRVAAFLLGGDLTGQLLTSGDTHLGRPAA